MRVRRSNHCAAASGNDERIDPPDDARAFGCTVVHILRSTLGGDFVGAYFVASIALGGYVKGESDLDILAVCRRPVGRQTRRVAVEELLRATTDCPARGLEFTLYRLEVVSSLPDQTDFEINVNGGPRMPQSVQSADEQPAFWYVLDRAIAHRHGIAIAGPPAREVVADVPRAHLLKAMHESMRWHREHEKATLYSVLNACRAWRFADEDALGSKLEGAHWARPRWPMPALIDAAVVLRSGGQAYLDEGEVDRFLDHVERRLSRAISA